MTVAGTDKPTIGFTGHYNDSDTELTYMQQRYYDPVAGRFLSEDPVLTDSNTGASFNRYVYASNNPYKYIDPDGRDDKDAFTPVPSAAEQFRPHGEMMGKAILEIGKAYVTVMSVLVPELGGARIAVGAGAAKLTSSAVKVEGTLAAETTVVRTTQAGDKAIRPPVLMGLLLIYHLKELKNLF